LQLRFEINRDAKTIRTEFVPGRIYQGYRDVVHGGIISTVLDEAMTKLAFMLGLDAVTGKLTVRFRNPLMVGEKIVATGSIIKESGRSIEARAEAVKDDGTVVAVADGLLIKLRKD
jgi:acyl-coenzyme A thioesterase PaaI-like protein